jgi:hypothetical protein
MYWIALTFMLFLPTRVEALDKVVTGEFIVEPPTLICAGFEWKIEGDDNRNAHVAVEYRRKEELTWKEGLPLFRLNGEKTMFPPMNIDYGAPNMFAGSIFDLKPDTEYECRFSMSDPDGVEGERAVTVFVRTRSEPKSSAGGAVYHVYPPDHRGPKEEPSFTGLKDAYFGSGWGDWSVAAPPRVEPGDTILVHAGIYKGQRYSYFDPLNLPFHGAYVLTKSGTPDKPIVIKAAGDGEVIFDGDGCYRLFDVMAANYTVFEGLTIRNTDIAFYAGLKDVMGSSGLAVKHCRLENVGIGVLTEHAGSKDFYIADNVIIGRHDRTKLHGWRGTWLQYGGPSPIDSYYGVKVYGQGHVVCHNYIAYFHDGICVCTHGMPEREQTLKCVSIDFYNNDLFLMADDFIEADGGVHNIRVFRNRGINAAEHGLSAQPVYGGPAYFVRNIVYNVPPGGAIKTNFNPSGLVVYHNTLCAEFDWSTDSMYSNAHFRNNVFLGTDFPKRSLIRTGTYTSYTSWDYDGFRLNRGSDIQFHWRGPTPADNATDYSIGSETAHQGFLSLKEFSQFTGHEKHGILVDYDIFERVVKPDHNDPTRVYRTEDMDFRLRPGSEAVDAGCLLNNINDGFSGKAPDLGAHELSLPVPVYGPRPSLDADE